MPAAIQTRREKFTEVYQNNTWHGTDSLSGTGSDLRQTAAVRTALPALLKELAVKSLLDAPCGDLHWIKTVDLGVRYVGVDIVQEIIQKLRLEFPPSTGRQFECRDLVTDPLSHADLILCRDCLVHLPLEDIRNVIRNFIHSGATWLLTTTFPNTPQNKEVRWSGWRPLNLQNPPLSLPAPHRLINEQCTEDDGKFSDKSLALWNLPALAPLFP